MFNLRRVLSRRELRDLEAVGEPCVKPFDSDLLRIVAFSDYRVQDISLLLDFLKKLEPKPHLILYGGDDVERFRVGKRNLFEELASFSAHGLCGVLGNDPPEDEESDGDEIRLIPDTKTLRAYIQGMNVYNVHERPLVLGKYAVIGSEGSPPDKEFGDVGVVIYSEQSIGRHLQLAAKSARGKLLIVVSHCPPRGALDLAVRFGRRRIGSVALRKFLAARKNVPLVVCGHAHFCGAQAQKLERSTVVNTASHDDFGAPGRIAIIEVRAGTVCGVQWHNLWELGSVCGIKELRA
ncbi:MAG: metallophosphoesterase, partial [Candidatus Korobacteraceae bacterium]